jgi:hypothetical protein
MIDSRATIGGKYSQTHVHRPLSHSISKEDIMAEYE